MRENEQPGMIPRFSGWANGKIWVSAFLEWCGLALGMKWEWGNSELSLESAVLRCLWVHLMGRGSHAQAIRCSKSVRVGIGGTEVRALDTMEV